MYNKIKKNFAPIILLLTIAGSIIILPSCEKEDEAIEASSKKANVEERTIPLHPGSIYEIIDIITDQFQGTFYRTETIYPDGTYTLKQGCKGWIGTCSINIETINGGDNVTIGDQSDIVEGEADYKVYAKLINCDAGILYAIEKNKYPDLAKRFFYDDVINISGKLVINNPKVLEELRIEKPISIFGAYPVYESEDFKFIKISENK